MTPNFGQMGTESLPGGNGPADLGQGAQTLAGSVIPTGSMQGPGSPAHENVGYRPEAGRADRLSANIVGGSDFDNLASGGYSGGATSRI
jgi:hypothetical protein